MSFPVFDLHCDTAIELLRHGGNLRKNSLHIDLDRAAKFPAYAQCFACYTSELTSRPAGMTVTQLFEQELETIKREIARNEDIISLALSAEDIEKSVSSGKMAAVLTIEGTAGFGFDPDRLEELYQIGFRISTLGWNESNPLTGSHITGQGLSDRGREYIKQAQNLGMIVDVSHISDSGFWDIMDITDAPIIASHSNSRSVWNVSRNLTDDMFRAICQTGGVAGINQYADFLGEQPNLDTVCDHIFHFLEMDPLAQHISLGADMDGCDQLPDGFSGIQDYPRLAQKMKSRGLDDIMIENIYWNNAIGVMKRCCM